MATLFQQRKSWWLSFTSTLKRQTGSSLDIGNFVADAAEAMTQSLVLTFDWFSKRVYNNEIAKRVDEDTKKKFRDCMNMSNEVDLLELANFILKTRQQREVAHQRKALLDKRIRDNVITYLKRNKFITHEKNFRSLTIDELLEQYVQHQNPDSKDKKPFSLPQQPKVSDPVPSHEMIIKLNELLKKILSETLHSDVQALVEVEEQLERTLWIDMFFTWFKADLVKELSKETKRNVRALVEDCTEVECLQYFYEQYKAAKEEKKLKTNRYIYSILGQSFIYSLPLLGLGLTLPSFISLVLQSFAIVWAPPLWMGVVLGVALALIAFTAFYYSKTSEANPELTAIGKDKWDIIFKEKAKLQQQIAKHAPDHSAILGPERLEKSTLTVPTGEVDYAINTLVLNALKQMNNQEAVLASGFLPVPVTAPSVQQQASKQEGMGDAAILRSLNKGDVVTFTLADIDHSVEDGKLQVRVVSDQPSTPQFIGGQLQRPGWFAIQPLILPAVMVQPVAAAPQEKKPDEREATKSEGVTSAGQTLPPPPAVTSLTPTPSATSM